MKSYSTVEAAAFCHVDRRTTLRWVESGALASWTSGGGRHRIPAGALVAFMRAHGIPLPAELFVPPSAALYAVVYGDGEAVVRATFPEARVEAEADAFDLGLRLGREIPNVLVVDGARADARKVVRRVGTDPELATVRIIVLGGSSELGGDATVRDAAGLRKAVYPPEDAS